MIHSSSSADETSSLPSSSESSSSSPIPIRILTGGIMHESNTFNPIPTTMEEFRIRRGTQVLENQPWAEFLQELGVEVLPTTHANARPFGVVSRAAYEALKAEILEGARLHAASLQGIYLDFHGALHVEGYEDAQLDLVESLRRIVGDEVLLAASFDLHGNLSSSFVNALDIMTAYRTAPHVDQKETKTRAVSLLYHAIVKKHHPVVAHLNVPILISGEKGVTSVEPLRSLYAQLPLLIEEHEWLLDASIFVGMPWTDVRRAGMSLQVVASDPSFLDLAQTEAERLAQELWDHRHELTFDVETDDLEGAISTAVDAPEPTVFVTDSGDNPGAGGAGDNPLFLKRLLARGVNDALVAGIVDSEAVSVCEQAGVGAQVDLTLGGKLDTQHGQPFAVRAMVRLLSEPAVCTKRRPAVVEVDGILVVLLNERRSFYALRDFEEVGIDPLKFKIVVVKLGYLTQQLRDIAPRTIMAMTRGFTDQEIEKLSYQSLRRPIYPLDHDMQWTPQSGKLC